MKIIDITRPLFRESVVYPGDAEPSFSQEDAGVYLISSLRMSTHSGTHIDAPVHYLKSGTTVDEIPLTQLIGPCRVLDLTDAGDSIMSRDLKGHMAGAKRLLLKTRFSHEQVFRRNYPCIDLSAAREITKAGIECVGIDSPSIEVCNSNGSVHREILGHGCVIIELLNLEDVPEGEYDMIALPLRLAGLDGSPARVVLTQKR
jgi:arylformamidase